MQTSHGKNDKRDLFEQKTAGCNMQLFSTAQAIFLMESGTGKQSKNFYSAQIIFLTQSL